MKNKYFCFSLLGFYFCYCLCNIYYLVLCEEVIGVCKKKVLVFVEFYFKYVKFKVEYFNFFSE